MNVVTDILKKSASLLAYVVVALIAIALVGVILL